MKNCIKTLIIFCILVLMCATSSSCSLVNDAYFDKADSTGELTQMSEDCLYVTAIDVGQADSLLIRQGNTAMLIDGGNVADGQTVCDYIADIGITEIDYLINTHAHEDHCGGLTDVVNTFSVGNAIISPKTADSKCYKDFIDALDENNVATYTATVGETFSVGGATAQIIGPEQETAKSSNLNNTSVIVKLTYKSQSFLFMGDAETDEEKSLIHSGADLSCTVLKAGHHGSATSASYVFIREAMPQYTIISVGAGNSYNHPNQNTVSRFRDADSQLYRTDLSGNITITVDKDSKVFVKTEK